MGWAGNRAKAQARESQPTVVFRNKMVRAVTAPTRPGTQGRGNRGASGTIREPPAIERSCSAATQGPGRVNRSRRIVARKRDQRKDRACSRCGRTRASPWSSARIRSIAGRTSSPRCNRSRRRLGRCEKSSSSSTTTTRSLREPRLNCQASAFSRAAGLRGCPAHETRGSGRPSATSSYSWTTTPGQNPAGSRI